MTYTTCPKCKQQIESDSWFCDQCGTELFVCPQCRELRKGKRCTTCGTPLISMSSWGQAVNKSAGTPQTAKTTPPTPPTTYTAEPPRPSAGVAQPAEPAISKPPVQAAQPPSPSATVRPGQTPPVNVATLKQPGHIQSATPFIRLGLEPGVIIGRRGSYAAVFAPYGMVSGIHAQLDRQPNGQWTITDLGSTNGSTLNGQALTPQVPVPFNVGDTMTFADLTFSVLE